MSDVGGIPRYLALFTGSVALGFSANAAQPATADHYVGGTGAEGCVTLNAPQVEATQHYYYDDLQSESSAAITWNRTNNINPTQMNTEDQFNYNDRTDVWVGDKYYDDYCSVDWYQGPTDPNGSGAVGMGNCFREASTAAGARCDQHDLRLNNHFTDNTTTSNVRGLACHEAGHTLGLGHRESTNSCMPQGYPKPTNTYAPHDVDGINQNS